VTKEEKLIIYDVNAVTWQNATTAPAVDRPVRSRRRRPHSVTSFPVSRQDVTIRATAENGLKQDAASAETIYYVDDTLARNGRQNDTLARNGRQDSRRIENPSITRTFY